METIALPIGQEAEWAGEAVWNWRRQKPLALVPIVNPYL
jgi:hypothetical protein